NFINNFSDLPKEQLDEFKTSKDIALLDLIEKNIKAIHKQGDKANNIITKMLAHSRLKSSDATQTNIHSLIEEDLSLALHSFKMKNPLFQIFVKKDFDEKIPIISLSREDFSRTLLNLINNALYALVSKKGQNPTLSIKTEATKNGVIIKIRDNGVGISKEVQEKLYVPFFTTKPTGIGTGLGLSLARAYIVDELGGKIECKSKEGEFTEFTLFIPIRTEMARLHRSDEA
ncbi:MAG: sensor histidine kinase, partial [Parachlamydiaceae bacterium]